MTAKEQTVKLFQDKQVRSHWSAQDEKWYISIVDVVEVLTQSDRPRKYWDDLKRKLTIDGSELSEKIGQLKMRAPDGKMRMTDVADVEQLFRRQSFIKKRRSGGNWSSLQVTNNIF